jgi:ribosome-associated protein
MEELELKPDTAGDNAGDTAADTAAAPTDAVGAGDADEPQEEVFDGGSEGGADGADPASLMEAATRRDRTREIVDPAEMAVIHAQALLAGQASSDVKGENVKVLDMRELISYTDYLVLSTGRNSRLTKRIAEEVHFKLKQEYNILPFGTEGAGDGEWILLDYLDFMVHVFTPEAREFYRLDVLWKRAPVETVE